MSNASVQPGGVLLGQAKRFDHAAGQIATPLTKATMPKAQSKDPSPTPGYQRPKTTPTFRPSPGPESIRLLYPCKPDVYANRQLPADNG